MMTAEAVILEQIILNRIALLEARTEEICALLSEEKDAGRDLSRR